MTVKWPSTATPVVSAMNALISSERPFLLYARFTPTDPLGLRTQSTSIPPPNPSLDASLKSPTGALRPPATPTSHWPLLNAAFAEDAHRTEINRTAYPYFGFMIPPPIRVAAIHPTGADSSLRVLKSTVCRQPYGAPDAWGSTS